MNLKLDRLKAKDAIDLIGSYVVYDGDDYSVITIKYVKNDDLRRLILTVDTDYLSQNGCEDFCLERDIIIRETLTDEDFSELVRFIRKWRNL
jgi:hypothetical protein